MKNYPERILPKPHFKLIEDIELIKRGILIHYTDSKDNRDSDKLLKEDALARHENHIRDYSNNLLGVFETADIYIDVTVSESKEYFISLWNIGQSVTTPIFKKDFVINSERGYFFLRISDFHNEVVNYEDLDDPDQSIKATCKVLHTPTNSNFWHFSLRWETKDGLDIFTLKEKQKKGMQKRILSAAKSLIISKAIFNEPSYSELDVNIYS